MSRFIAIDADAGGLFVAAGSARGGAVRVEQAVASLDDPRPLSAVTADELGKRLKAVLAEARIPAAPALVCLGRDRVVFKDIRHPKTAPADEPAVVRFQSQRDLAESPDDLHMDYVPVPVPAGAEDARATVVFVKKDIYAAAKAMCEAAGLKLVGVTPRPFATAAAVRSAVATSAVPPPDDPTAPVAVLSVWDGGGEFVVSHRDQILFTRTLPASALSGEQSLVGETKRSLAAVAAGHPKSPVQAVYLAESHTSGGSWAARLQVSLPVPVYPFDPIAGYADIPLQLRGRFLGPVGLLAARAAGPLSINFVAPRQPRAEVSKARSRGLLAGLVAAAVIAAAGSAAFIMHKDLDRKITDQGTLKTQVENELKAEQANINRLAAVDDFRSRDVCWADVLYDLAKVYPDINKMRLKGLKAEVEVPKPEARKVGAAAVKPPAGTAPTGGLTGLRTATAAKPAEVKAPGKLTLTVLTPDSKLAYNLQQVFDADPKAYQKSNVNYTNAGTSRTTDAQELIVTVDVLKRKPTDYTGVITAKIPAAPPPVPAAAPAPAFGDPDFQEQP